MSIYTTNYIQKKKMAGKLWEDKDFEVCKMDPYCSERNEALKDKREEEKFESSGPGKSLGKRKKLGLVETTYLRQSWSRNMQD